MTDPAEKLQKWVVEELNIITEGRLQKIPNIESLRFLMTGKNRRIWTYIFDHVHAENKVYKIKRSLLLKRKLEDDQIVVPHLLDEKVSVLRQAIAKAEEKQIHLKESISLIQDRITGIEHDTEIIKQETLKYNQKSAFLYVLGHKYEKKNKSLKIMLNNITALAKRNNLFRKTNLPSGFAETKTPEFKLKEIFDTSNDHAYEEMLFSIITQDDSYEASLQNFNNLLAENVLFLPDLIVTFKKVCTNSLDNVINLSLQSGLSSGDAKIVHNKNDLINHFQYDYISNCLQVKKTSKVISHVLENKEKIQNNLSNKLTNSQYAHALPLLQMLAENDMYVKSNMFLEECVRKEKSKTSKILKKNFVQKQKIMQLQCFQNDYFKCYNVIGWLISACEKTFQNILCETERLSKFAHQDVFTKEPILRKCIVEFKQLLEQDRRMRWKYWDGKNIIKANFLGKTEISVLSNDLQKSFSISPFQNIDKVYEKWYQLKVRLHENNFERNLFIDIYRPDNLRMFSVFLEDFKKMKQALNKASSNVDRSLSTLEKFRNLLIDWWEQNAQFIPNIEYDGKPLKVWIGLLSVLPDF